MADPVRVVTILIRPNAIDEMFIFATLENRLMSDSGTEPKLTVEERLVQATDDLWATRLWVVVNQALEAKGITDPEAIGEALGLPALVAASLLARQKWQIGDVLLLEAAAMRLGLAVEALDPWRP